MISKVLIKEVCVSSNHQHFNFLASIQMRISIISTLLILIFCISCTPVSSQQTVSRTEPAFDPPPPAPQVFFYPNRGQDKGQQERDQYECYVWASAQTGFDPSLPNLAPHHRVQIVTQPEPGHDTVLGAAAGAIIGAAIGAPANTAKGAAVGAVAGAVIGAASDSSREEQTYRIQQQYDKDIASQYANNEKKSRNYRRALGACLEGRGYTVR